DGEPDQVLDSDDFIWEEIPGGARTLNSQQQEYQFVSKLNYALSPEQQGQLTFSGQPFANDINGSYGLPSATHYKVSGLGTDLAAKWTSKFNNNKTEVEATGGWHRAKTNVDSDLAGAMSQPSQTLLYGHLGEWAKLGG